MGQPLNGVRFYPILIIDRAHEIMTACHAPRCCIRRPKHGWVYCLALSCYNGGRRKDTIHAIRLEFRWSLRYPQHSYHCMSKIQIGEVRRNHSRLKGL